MRNSKKNKKQRESFATEALHDSICEKVAEELLNRGFNVEHHKEYHNIKDGELDVIGYRNKYAIIVEVKYRNKGCNKRKATRQLERAEEYCPFLQDKRIFKMYAYHVNDTYNIELII